MQNKLTSNKLTTLSRSELRSAVQEMAGDLNRRLEQGEEIDVILDEENPFSIFEPFLEPVEYPILAITIINNFQSDVVMDALLDALETGIQKYRTQY